MGRPRKDVTKTPAQRKADSRAKAKRPPSALEAADALDNPAPPVKAKRPPRPAQAAPVPPPREGRKVHVGWDALTGAPVYR